MPGAKPGHWCLPLLFGGILVFGPGAVLADSRDALQRAAALVQQGRLAEAEQQARLALSDPDTQPAAYSLLGTVRLQQKRLDDSAGFLRKAIELEPGLLGAHLNLAEVYVRQGNRAAAGDLAKTWMRLPNAPQEVSIKFALVLAQGGVVAPAIEVLEHVRRAGPPSYELAFNLGSAYLLNADPPRALDAYDLALSLKPDSIPALRQAAAVAERQSELERSLSYWIRAKKIAPADPEVLLGFGRVCLKMDLLEDAEPALVEAARLKPAETSYQYTLAVARVGKRQYEAAQQLLEPLVQKQPQDPHLQYALGSVLYVQGHLDEAAVHLKESIRLLPDQLAAHYYLGLVAKDRGNASEAIELLETLLHRYPDHAASCEALGGLLMSAQRYDEAERRLRNAVRLNPKSVKANYQLGLLLARMGKKEEADKQLQLTKSLREDDEASSRLQLRLIDPDQ